MGLRRGPLGAPIRRLLVDTAGESGAETATLGLASVPTPRSGFGGAVPARCGQLHQSVTHAPRRERESTQLRRFAGRCHDRASHLLGASYSTTPHFASAVTHALGIDARNIHRRSKQPLPSTGLLHGEVTSKMACPKGRAERMSVCPDPFRKSSVRTSCGWPATAARG